MENNEQKEKKEQPQTEVIARKANGYLGAVILTLVFGVFFALIGAVIILLGIVEHGPVTMFIVAAVMFGGGVGLSVYSSISLVRLRRIPKIIITREGDSVTINGTKSLSVTIKIAEITNVSYYQMYGRGQTQPWGTLVLIFGETECKLGFIKDVVAAHNRLFALMLDEKKKAQESESQKQDSAAEEGESNG